MPSKERIITKSKYLTGLQCPKCLWITFNQPERLPEISKDTSQVFDQGNIVGELAKTLYPDGIDIPYNDFKDSIKQTKKLLSLRKPLFEASILAGSYYSRVDILKPASGGAWDIIEVKSSTGVSDVYLHDVSFQRFCLQQAGLKVSKCYLMHINNQYVRCGDIEPKELFIKEDITQQAKEYGVGIEGRLKSMQAIINSKKCPEVTISPNCTSPYECRLMPECWGFLPKDNIFNLYRFRKDTAFRLFRKGIFNINDIPDDINLNPSQRIQCECVKSNAPYVNKKSLSRFLESLEFPLYFIDFETFNVPIPQYDGTRPYMQVPFQFSVHVLDSLNAKPAHHGYLADGKKDPRPEILSRLKKILGTKGTIMAYNMSFEIARLRECSSEFKEYQSWFNKISSRFTDLLTPFRSFDYYHPLQKGSCSIKKLAPAIINKSYDNMEIADGSSASSEYVRVTFTEAQEEERKRIYKALEKYCELDTYVMVEIVEELKRIIS